MSTRAAVTTFLPRSEEVIAATREWERGRRSREDVDALYARWTQTVLQFEREQGFAWRTGGHLAWQDLLRPLVESSDGIVPGALTRWFETNSFYRRPVVEKLPSLDAGKISRMVPSADPDLTVILPGPWTFTGLSENRTGQGESAVARSLARYLREAIDTLSRAGVKRFLLHEPLLAYTGEAPEDELRELYRIVTGGRPPSEFLLWTYFGNGAWLLPEAPKLGVSLVGVDLSETPLQDLTGSALPPGSSIGLGCIDPRTSLTEDPKDLDRLVKDVEAALHPGTLLLGPAAPMDLLPWDTAREKLAVLRPFAGGTS